MIIKVIGKQHRSGNSKKTGKAYDFSEVYFLGENRFVEGQIGMSCTVDPSMVPFAQIVVGAEYVADFGPGGYLQGFKRK